MEDEVSLKRGLYVIKISSSILLIITVLLQNLSMQSFL